MDNAMSIAASGMQAASARLETAASNIVNNDIATTTPGGTGNASQPVTPLLAYDPAAPYANMQGMVGGSSGGLPADLVNLKEAETGFRASLLAYKTSSQMFKTLLDATA